MRLPRLQRLVALVSQDGTPLSVFQRWWQIIVEAIEANTVALENSVVKDSTPAWNDPSGTLTRTTFVAYAGQTISNPPTQAEVQAIDDHVKVLSEALAALITDLRANGVLT